LPTHSLGDLRRDYFARAIWVQIRDGKSQITPGSALDGLACAGKTGNCRPQSTKTLVSLCPRAGDLTLTTPGKSTKRM
jgi:hypothetical protein